MTFDFKEQQDIGTGYWKMNSSILKDDLYKNEIEKAIQGIKDLNIHNPLVVGLIYYSGARRNHEIH